MPNKRSEKGKIKQEIRRLIYTTSFQDSILAETVCRVSKEELDGLKWTLMAQFGGTDLDVRVPNVEKGLILSDSRGKGAFQ